MRKPIYIFIDPFNSINSGVTTYINLAKERLCQMDLFSIVIISKFNMESIEVFRKRVAHEVKCYSNLFCIEVPESMAASLYIKQQEKVHIRIHCGKTLGKYVQGIKYNYKDKNEELAVITKAKWVTAPSRVAKQYTEEFYDTYRPIEIYPNPAVELIYQTNELKNKTIDILFLGRYQTLKGIDFLEDFSSKLDSHITLLTNDRKITSKKFNIVYHDSIEEKFNHLRQAKIVIIPSIFDIYSMVAIEAIAAGAYVITWQHIGITEYIDKKCLTAVKSWDIIGFVNEIANVQKGFNMKLPNKNTTKNIKNINQKFDQALISFFKNQAFKSVIKQGIKYLPLEDLIKTSPIYEKKVMKRDQIYRKVRKLLLNPEQFWKDSKLREKFFLKENDLIEVKTISSNTNISVQKLVKAKEVEKPLIKNLTNVGMDDVNNNGLIKLKFLDIPKPKSSGSIYVFGELDFIINLSNYLFQHKDFSPFHEENFRGFHFKNINKVNVSALDLLNRMDVKTKDYLNSYSNVFLFNPSGEVIKFFSSIGYDKKLTIIFSDETMDINKEIYFEYIDTIIFHENININIENLKKFFVYKNNLELSYYIRKIIQDNLDKKINMLLPIYQGLDLSNIVKNFNGDQFDGVVILKKDFLASDYNFENFDQFLMEMSGLVIDIMLKESIYLEFKNICDGMGSVSHIYVLLKTLTKSGVILDVQT